MRIRLGDDDRARLGIEVEWLDCDLSRLPMDEAEAFEEASGLEYHNLGGMSAKAVRAKVWLGLHRAGVEFEWDKLRFDLGATQIEARPGKARSGHAGTPTSTTSSTSTPPTRKPRSAA
ncbi:MAG: hypothetical protein ACM30G_05015 [Micromonosporaceae bacterium]